MKKLLTITFEEAHRGGVTYSVTKNPLYYRSDTLPRNPISSSSKPSPSACFRVMASNSFLYSVTLSNGYSLNDDIVQTIIDPVEDFMIEHVPNELIKKNKEIELEVYRIGNLILVIDEITRSKSKRWLDSAYLNFNNTVDFDGGYYNFLIAAESKIICLPNSLILNKLGVFIGLTESQVDIKSINVLKDLISNFLKDKPTSDGKFQNIIFKKSRLYVGTLYLPVKEYIYFTETFCVGPRCSFYYRDKEIEAEKYPTNMLVDKCELKTKSELSIELDNLAILDLCNIKYSSGSTRKKIDIKIKDGSNL